MTEFGDELHRILAQRGISLSAAARGAGCSKGYLSNAANGRKAITPRVAAGLDRLFGTDGTFAAYALVLSPGSSAPASISPQTADTASKTPARPQTARSTRETANDTAPDDSVAPWLAGTEEAGRFGHALAHPAGADLVAVAHLREQVRGLDEQYDRSPAATLIAETGQCLGQIGFLRVHARRADVRLDLCAAYAEAATLMGQLVWDASQRRDQSRADEAAAALHMAIDVIEVSWGGGGLNIVFTAARQLRRWHQLSAVRDVSDRLLALMAAA
jgi:transcriptional regulator with XRE-family HTH domain